MSWTGLVRRDSSVSQPFEIRNVRGRGAIGGWQRCVFVDGRKLCLLRVFGMYFRQGWSVQSLADKHQVDRETAENILRHWLNEELGAR